MEFLDELNKIEKEIQGYYEMSFDNDKEDYNYNKYLKNKLKQLIIDIKKSQSNVTNAVLLVLAKSTGCAEDHEIAENIVNQLHNKKYLNNKELDYFYDNLSTRRWM